MAINYGIRYLTADQFVKYCSALNVKTDIKELEYYEKVGIMLPVARVVYPGEYVKLEVLWTIGETDEPPQLDQWPELQRLVEETKILPKDNADLPDEELIDSFDREMGVNPYLTCPTLETFQPWDSYNIVISSQNAHQRRRSSAKHYYNYWQVHQLYYIKQFPDLYKTTILLNNIPEEAIKDIVGPCIPSKDDICNFNGKARMFDALSFWITMYNREHKRTYALIPEEHHVKILDEPQVIAFQRRLVENAKNVEERYGLNIKTSYDFLYELLELHKRYQDDERYKLSEELKNDIFYQAQLIILIFDQKWENIEEELGNRHGLGMKNRFRHLNTMLKERDEARDLLAHFAGEYRKVIEKYNIPKPEFIFRANEIDEFLDYCESEGLTIFFTALSGMIATGEEYAVKFRRVTRYTNIKNVLTALEFLLKSFAANGDFHLNGKSLNPVIKEMMKSEKWFRLFKDKTDKGLTHAKDPTEFFININQLVNDSDLVQSEETFWAREFLIASLARILTVHSYPDYDWFYGQLFGEMLGAALYSVMYSWQVANREGWV